MRGQFNAPRKADNPMPDLSVDPIACLKSRWNDLHDLDRAQEIVAIHRSHVSFNQIARGLERSAALLRHLLPCLDASAEDQDLARQGQLSTNELAKRGLAARKRRTAPPPEAVEAPRPQSADEGADLICDWILEEPLSGLNRVQIIEDVLNERFAVHRSRPALPGHAALPLTELIQRYKPNTRLHKNLDSTDRRLEMLNEYTEWLDRWSFFAFKDSAIRDGALEQALKRLTGK